MGRAYWRMKLWKKRLFSFLCHRTSNHRMNHHYISLVKYGISTQAHTYTAYTTHKFKVRMPAVTQSIWRASPLFVIRIRPFWLLLFFDVFWWYKGYVHLWETRVAMSKVHTPSWYNLVIRATKNDRQEAECDQNATRMRQKRTAMWYPCTSGLLKLR